VIELQAKHPRRRGVWIVDLGIRSAGNAERQRLRQWLEREYTPTHFIACGDRWTLAARRYEFVGAATEGTD
jgi:hypothetical protein